MHRHADTAAHADAVDQRDIGLGIVVDQQVEFVLLLKERVGQMAVAASLPFPQRPHVAAGAEGAIAHALDHDGMHMRIFGPCPQGFGAALDHVQVQRVQRARAVHQNAAHAAVAANDQGVFGAHAGVSVLPDRLARRAAGGQSLRGPPWNGSKAGQTEDG